MLHPKRTDDGSLLAMWQEELKQAATNPFLFQLLLKQMQRVLKRLAYFYQQLASLPRRNRRALQRALATSLVGAAMLLALSSAPMVQAASITVDPGASGVGGGDGCSLVEAIINANNDAATYAECVAGSGADTITLPAAATLDYLTAFGTATALPTVSSEVVIEANSSTISRNAAAPDFGLFYVDSSGDLTLNDARLEDGSFPFAPSLIGGGITNYGGTLEVNNCDISGNLAFIGGGINTIFGTTTVNDSTLYQNLAFGGGGLSVINGNLTVNNTLVAANYALVYGAGILNASAYATLPTSVDSNLTLNNSTVMYNTTYIEGGGIWTHGYDDPGVPPIPPPVAEGGSTQGSTSLKVFERLLRERANNFNLEDLKAKRVGAELKRARASGDVKVHTTRADDKDKTPKRDGTKRARRAGTKPEKINANTYATTHINDSTINNNHADYYGGGIATNEFARTYVTRTIITDNDAGEGGGVHNFYGEVSIANSTISYNEAFGEDGGGVRNDGGNVSVIGTTVVGNTAVDDGGGLNNRGYGTMNVTNSTLSGNIADSDSGGSGDGGGFRNVTGGIATLANVTIANNSAAYGGGLANEDDTVTLQRTLISGNRATVLGNEVANWYNIVADDYNLFGHGGEDNADAFYGFIAGATDITATSNGSNPTALASILSATLADNGSAIATPGGIVQTLALLLGSPAVDKAPNADCIAPPVDDVDERGFPRNVNVNNDSPTLRCDIGAYELQSPTAVNVTGLRGGVNKNGNVVLQWRTTTESQIAGFNVYRQGKQGEWKQINRTMRQAKHAGAALGDKYRFTDRKVNASKTYRYKIQVHYLDGHDEWTEAIKVQTP